MSYKYILYTVVKMYFFFTFSYVAYAIRLFVLYILENLSLHNLKWPVISGQYKWTPNSFLFELNDFFHPPPPPPPLQAQNHV